jgi:cation:H+ antiporter
VEILFLIALLLVAAWFIKCGVDSFEPAADYLGRNLPAGVKGATINAIGSSLPELMTASFLLFVYHDQAGFAAGVATCAGSAVFNAMVIPALCLLAIRGKQSPQAQPNDKPITHIHFEKSTLVREVLFFVAAEGLLIFLFEQGKQEAEAGLGWGAGLSLVSFYLFYLLFLYFQMRGKAPVEHVHQPDDEEDEEEKSFAAALRNVDFNRLFFGNRPFTAARAWSVALLAVLVLGGACYVLADVIVQMAGELGVPVYATAFILAAAATSIPDAILSIRDSKKGFYDDAIANAIGSNTFDIAVCIGLPLLCYVGIYGGDVKLGMSTAQIIELQVILGAVCIMAFSLLIFRGRIGLKRAITLLLFYVVFVGYVVVSLFGGSPPST